MAKTVSLLALLLVSTALMFAAGPVVQAADPDPLQDFCIADVDAGPTVNGFPCKLPALATTEDFAFSGLAEPANLAGNPFNATASLGFVRQWPALNTLGLSLVRLDINPGGIIPPHTHNLATEILFCLEGEIYTGFVANNFGNDPTISNKVYAKTVKKGEAFIFPRGLLHFQLNKGNVPAVSLNVLNSQNPGIQLMPTALFGGDIDPEMLAKSFFMTLTQVASLEAAFSPFA